MRRLAIVCTAVLAASVTIATGAQSALAATSSGSASVHAKAPAQWHPETAGSQAGFSFTIDPKTHTMRVNDITSLVQVRNAKGQLVSSGRMAHLSTLTGRAARAALARLPRKGLGSFNCIVDVQQNSRFKAYTPIIQHGHGPSWQLSYNFNPYSVDNARIVQGAYTFQVETCVTGGGNTKNWWHQWYNDGTTTASPVGRVHRIGWTWGTTPYASSGLPTSLSFQVSAGPVTINASDFAANQDTFTGLLGSDGNFSPKGWRGSWNNNRTSGQYISPNTYPWDGSNLFEGNDHQNLWEEPENSGFVHGYAASFMRAFCATAPGTQCVPY
ncbi:MAG TPA: hypothetical protein VGS19_30455 [Streptosporangiaceae bacterium]|nr:hypothetical protein [Streptosporangiaceae bacterium]